MTDLAASQSNTISQYSRSNADKAYADSRESLFGHLVIERGRSVKTALEELRPQIRQTLKATESAADWCQKIGIGSVLLGVLVGTSMSIGFGILPALAGCLSLKFWADSKDELPRREAEYHLLKECSNLPEALYALHLRGVSAVVLVGAYDALVSSVESRIERGAGFSESEVGQFLESKISGLIGLENQTQSQQGLQSANGQNPVFAHTPIGVPAVTELQPIAAAPSYTSPNLAPPKTRAELMARLKTDCPLLLKLVKSHPIRAVGIQRSGKTTLVKRLALLRMVLIEGHSVVASTPHYEAANPYPEAFDVVGVTPAGRRDYPAIERAWHRMASDVEACNMANITYVWDEFGVQDKAIPITPDNDPIKTVLTSCLRETKKFDIYPIFIIHGETAVFFPGSKGLVAVIMASTVRVETIGEMVEGEDGLETTQPTGRFNVTWLDGSKGEGVLPAWLTEEYLMGMISPRERASQKPAAPFITPQLSKDTDPPSISRGTIAHPSSTPTAAPMGSGRRPTRIRLGASSATPDRAWSTVPAEKVPDEPLDPAIELINAEPNIDRRDALMAAYLWAQGKLDKGEEVSRQAFLERARKERKSEYLIANRNKVWEDLQTLLD